MEVNCFKIKNKNQLNIFRKQLITVHKPFNIIYHISNLLFNLNNKHKIKN